MLEATEREEAAVADLTARLFGRIVPDSSARSPFIRDDESALVSIRGPLRVVGLTFSAAVCLPSLAAVTLCANGVAEATEPASNAAESMRDNDLLIE